MDDEELFYFYECRYCNMIYVSVHNLERCPDCGRELELQEDDEDDT